MDKGNLFDLLNVTAIGLSDKEVIFNMLVTISLAFFIYWVYKMTYSGVMYSKSFNITIVLVSTVTAMVMMVIGSNLALSLGMVGALSIIRFRSAIKDPKDVGYLFWGIAVGLSAGTGSYSIAITASLLIGIIIFILNINSVDDFSYLLVIKGSNFDAKDINIIVANHIKKFKLRMNNNNNGLREIIYEVRLKNVNEFDLMWELNNLEEVSVVNIISHNGEISG